MRHVWLAVGLVVIAGCADPAPSDDDGRAAESNLDEGRVYELTQEIPFSWHGRILLTACVPQGPNVCGPGIDLMDPAMGGETFQTVAMDADAFGVNLTMSWDASTLLTEDMDFAVLRQVPCGSGCRAAYGVGLDATGPSPLVLSTEVPVDMEEDGIGAWISVDVPSLPIPLYGKLGAWQEFRVEGTLSTYRAVGNATGPIETVR